MKICKIENCRKKHEAHGYCNRHYQQIRKYGEIKGNPSRTKYDPNEFIFEAEICRINLYDSFGNQTAQAIIDTEDYNKVKKYKWYLKKDGYVETRIAAKLILLHQIILGYIPNPKTQGDHRDRNKLDNRKRNLRFCTSSQNSINSKRRCDNTSGHKGVVWSIYYHKWISRIYFKKVQKHLGYFDDKIEAAKAYNKAALKYFREFAFLNEM